MLALSHAVTGAAIASQTTANPLLGYTLAVLSHPLLDLFPHWDFNTRHNGDRSVTKIIALSLTDASIGFLLGFLFFGSSVDPKILLTTMFLAQLPDWLEAPYHVFNWHFPPFTWIKKLQHLLHLKLAAPWGIFTQIAFISFLIAL